MLPGTQPVAEPQRRQTSLEVSGGQQDEPGLALSPDGPGASPEPPSVSHTPDGNAATDTLASDMLRKLAGTTVCVITFFNLILKTKILYGEFQPTIENTHFLSWV